MNYEYKVNGAFHAGTRRVECFTKSGAAAFASRLKCRATYVIFHDTQRPWRSWLPDDALLVRDAEDCSAEPEQFVSIKKVALGKHHRQPERVGATITAEGTTIPKPPFASLEIAHYLGDDSCYLFHISSDGEGTDTWHETLNEALDYAQDLYGVQRSEWLDVNHVFGSKE